MWNPSFIIGVLYSDIPEPQNLKDLLFNKLHFFGVVEELVSSQYFIDVVQVQWQEQGQGWYSHVEKFSSLDQDHENKLKSRD